MIWNRQLGKHDFRYSFMVSDGDRKAFNEVSANNKFGVISCEFTRPKI